MNNQHFDALALFSGGLDSLLAIKCIQEQGLSVLCLHYHTPFFGKPHNKNFWEKTYKITIRNIDVGEAFVNMLIQRPSQGFGSVLNPCIDCKILMLKHARTLVEKYNASCIISGEVLGQRPMSQRKDALNIIIRDAKVKTLLLRPLSAKLLDPTTAELEGIVGREKLHAISGRGRTHQLNLAKYYNITHIPTPGGGCRLTEKENARSYWPILNNLPHPTANDFHLANKGRQLWHSDFSSHWLTIGRKERDNAEIVRLATDNDILLKLIGFPGPIALARQYSGTWNKEALLSAASLIAGYSTKAIAFAQEEDKPVNVGLYKGSLETAPEIVQVFPIAKEEAPWQEKDWEHIREAIRTEQKMCR